MYITCIIYSELLLCSYKDAQYCILFESGVFQVSVFEVHFQYTPNFLYSSVTEDPSKVHPSDSHHKLSSDAKVIR